MLDAAERLALAACLSLLLLIRYLWSSDAPDAEEASMLRGGPPVRIALPGRAPPTKGHFSRWRCVGDMEDPDAFVRRTCLFEHVCYDTAEDGGEFYYYGRPANASAPTLYDHRRGAQRRFRQRKSEGDATNADFVALGKYVRHKKSKPSWSPRIVPGPAPVAGRETLRGLTALSAPFVPTNLGHVAWDEAFPLLVGMAQLGEYTRELRILRTLGCDVLKSVGSRKVCAKFESAFLAPLLGTRHAALQTLAQLRLAHPRRLLCFEKPLLHLYRARVLAWHGVAPAATPTTHQILLVNKQGKRGIGNYKRVRAHLVERFEQPGLARVVETSYAGLSMAEQFALLSQTTVAISPCGGISMILPFLPEGAYAVLLNYMLGDDEAKRHGECDGCSWSMEAELWRHVRHVNKMYYQVFSGDDFARGRPGRDATVRVEPRRMGDLVQQALHEMEPF